MDFVHNPYRCGPLRVGRYDLDPLAIKNDILCLIVHEIVLYRQQINTP